MVHFTRSCLCARLWLVNIPPNCLLQTISDLRCFPSNDSIDGMLWSRDRHLLKMILLKNKDFGYFWLTSPQIRHKCSRHAGIAAFGCIWPCLAISGHCILSQMYVTWSSMATIGHNWLLSHSWLIVTMLDHNYGLSVFQSNCILMLMEMLATYRWLTVRGLCSVICLWQQGWSFLVVLGFWGCCV